MEVHDFYKSSCYEDEMVVFFSWAVVSFVFSFGSHLNYKYFLRNHQLPFYYSILENAKLRHGRGRPSRSDLVQFQFIEELKWHEQNIKY